MGIYFFGVRVRFDRNTPAELLWIADRRGFDGEALVRTSRLTARIDNNAIADGFQIYLHSFVLTANGEWAVVRSEEHTSELQSRVDLVCRLLLEKKKKKINK